MEFLTASSDSFELIELDKQLTECQELLFKGLKDDSAVLCTESKTFAIRSVQTTNTLLLIQNSQVSKSLNSYFEVVEVLPRTERLFELLQTYPYKGPDEEMQMSINNPEHDKILYELKMESLSENIQASDMEIKDALKIYDAIEIHGSWRILDKEFIHLVLNLILLTCQEETASTDSILFSSMAASLSDHEISEFIVFHVLKIFKSNMISKGNDYIFTLDKSKIARFYAEHLMIFQQMNNVPVSQFMSEWTRIVPDGFSIDIELLQGIAFIDDESFVEKIRYFPKSVLEIDPKLRFQQLFQAKKKWSRKNILPYVSDLASTEKKLDAVFLKFARSFKEKGFVHYTSR